MVRIEKCVQHLDGSYSATGNVLYSGLSSDGCYSLDIGGRCSRGELVYALQSRGSMRFSAMVDYYYYDMVYQAIFNRRREKTGLDGFVQARLRVQ